MSINKVNFPFGYNFSSSSDNIDTKKAKSYQETNLAKGDSIDTVDFLIASDTIKAKNAHRQIDLRLKNLKDTAKRVFSG